MNFISVEPSENNGVRRRSIWHLLMLCAMALLLVPLWVGCKQPIGAASDINPVGTYQLVKVGGKELPCAVAHEGAPVVKSGVFSINPDATCSSKILFSVASHADELREVKATYTRIGARLTMKWEGAGVTIGSVAGDTFTMDNEGIIFEYRR